MYKRLVYTEFFSLFYEYKEIKKLNLLNNEKIIQYFYTH